MIQLIPDWKEAGRFLSVKFPAFIALVLLPSWMALTDAQRDAIVTFIGNYVGGNQNVGPLAALVALVIQIAVRLIKQSEE